MLFQGKKEVDRIDMYSKDFEEDPVLRSSEKFYDFTREEQQEDLLRKVRHIFQNKNTNYYENYYSHFLPWSELGL